MIAINDSNADIVIRAALKQADRKGKLGVLAAVVGISGGEGALREIMDSSGPLSTMDRGMLAMHLDFSMTAADAPGSRDAEPIASIKEVPRE